MNTAIAIFAKTIGLSPTKTRLAAEIGKEQAESFYALSVDVIEEVVQTTCQHSSHSLTPFWAVAEEAGVTDKRWQQFEALWTGPGGLGERLHHIYSTLLEKYDAVILIGSDSPQLQATRIEEAITTLNTQNIVIGPCSDGGFYLFGGKIHLTKEQWLTPEYSQSNTLESLLRALHPEPHYSLSIEQDVDHYADLLTLQQTLISKSRLPKQEQLLNWLSTLNRQ